MIYTLDELLLIQELALEKRDKLNRAKRQGVNNHYIEEDEKLVNETIEKTIKLIQEVK